MAGVEQRAAAVSRIRMRRNQHDAVALVAALRRRGCSPVLLKGVATQQLLYPGEVRAANDVDLLVAPGEAAAARRALAELGYRRFRRSGHATSWAAGGRVPVDLHRTLPRCQVGARTVWRTLADHRTTLHVDGGDFTVLDAAAMAVHLTLHLTQGASERALEDLRRAVVVLADDDWEAAVALAGRLGTATSLAWALDQVPGGARRRRQLGLAPIPRTSLPARKPFEAGFVAFATSPVHWRERAGALGEATGVLAGRASLAAWAEEHQRPVPTSRASSLATLATRTWLGARRRWEQH